MKSIKFIAILIILMACSPGPDNFQPESVVETYYNSLNNKDYSTMYSLISDGFKRIDPFAKDLDTFENVPVIDQHL